MRDSYKIKWVDKHGFERITAVKSLEDAIYYRRELHRREAVIFFEGKEIVLEEKAES